ncbi:DUF1336-containing protein [Aureococcus anophagefferens]|nr:DUF1336-containing protein [Aureococcus anophagefferens]
MAPPISGAALKRGRYQGTWRERFFYMAEGSSTLRYWESDADRLAGLRARGEFEVFGAAPLGDASERPWVVAVHVAAGGRVEAALRAAGVPSREEWLALPSAEARDAWVAALAAAAAPEKSARGEAFALDDDVWADAAQTAAPAGVGGASVYDYSIVREGWRVRVTYHVLVTVDGPAAGAAAEPWSVRRTHGDFRALLARLDATQQHRDMADDFATLEDVARLDRRHGAMNPKRFLSSRHLRRRVALLNSLLARVVRDDALRTSEAFRDFIRPQPLRDVDDRAPPAARPARAAEAPRRAPPGRLRREAPRGARARRRRGGRRVLPQLLHALGQLRHLLGPAAAGRRAAARVLDDFVRARDDGHRDARLKLIPRVVEGNWLVRRAVGGGHNAAKLAEALKLSYFSGPDYFEVDADIVGSGAARRILSVVKSATSELVLDLALVVEGATPEDLPEQVLGAVRLHRVDPALALALDLCPLASG